MDIVRSTKTLVIFMLALAFSTFSTVSARAETSGPRWKILAVSNPTNFKPGDQTGSDAIVVTATNVGGGSTGCTATTIERETLREKEEEAHGIAGSDVKHEFCRRGSTVVPSITIGDVLPAGMKAVEVFGDDAYRNPVGKVSKENGEPEGLPFGLGCTLSPSAPSCTTSEPVDPGDTLVITIRVDVESEEALKLTPASCEVPAGAVDCLTDEASVSGGGTADASVSNPVTIGSELPAYGVANGASFAATSTSQAGGHPNVTTAFFLNTVNQKGDALGEHGCGYNFPPECTLQSEPVGAPKDVSFDLPTGLVGTTVGVARCTMADVAQEAECPRNTMVGTATLIVFNPNGARIVLTVPIYNIAPSPGEPAAFAFNALFYSVRLDTSVLSDGKDNVRVTAPDLTEGAADYYSSVTIWGDPAEHNGPGPDAAANDINGNLYVANNEAKPDISFGGPGLEEYVSGSKEFKYVFDKRVPLLTNPSQCSSPLTAVLETDSWEGLGPGYFVNEPISMGTATGCGQLSFDPSVSMLPDTLQAGAPAGYSFDLTVPQDSEAEGLATPDVKRTSVTLPAGTVISPSAADGLGDCTTEQFFGPVGKRGLAEPAVPGSCPRDSQVGIVRVKTPALEERLDGEVFLGAPECTGPGGVCTAQDAGDGKMIRLFLQLVGEGEDGIVLKLEGTGEINQQTGQLTTVFEDTPQLPFSELQLILTGGERATLSNPRTCGEKTTTADLTPWSMPYTPDATPTSSFEVDENCFGSQFDPSFSFGTTSNQAGGYSPFSVSFGRGDDDGFLNGIQVRTPPGLLGMLSHVKLCEEPQAAQGTCGPESQIGETSVETGPGADPFLVTGGKVYITGPYKGAPYGLSIVVPAKAGPYTLSGTTGDGTVVVRSAISVNPETAALTVTSDQLPTELDGIPLQLRLVNVTINRPEFIFNATSCDKMVIGGTLTDTQAAGVNDASSYQVTNCAALKFQPKFAVTTSGKTSRARGASLDAKVTYPGTGQGTQADIAKVKVSLPKQLPSRLTTLRKACTAAQFEANPAGCPAASVIGVARVSTPVLPVQLTGAVYFVSHGGEAFPSLTIVLQGDGVRVDLAGTTFISNAGITSTTFKTVPDVPFSSFELYLPEGSYSALAANTSLCGKSLQMPTEFVAQNGSEIHENTKIAITGCTKTKKTTTTKKKKKNKKTKAKRATRRARKASHVQGGRS